MSSNLDPFSYQVGFDQELQSESLPDSLPILGNTPLFCPRGLYAEQLSGSAFTAPRAANKRTWLYRIHPSVGHGLFRQVPSDNITADFKDQTITPNQLRWGRDETVSSSFTFVEGIRTVCGFGSVELKKGLSIHLYSFERAMGKRAFCNADGDMLVVPQAGNLVIRTEMGRLHVRVGEIFVVQRGVRWAVDPAQEVAPGSRLSGYILEVFAGHFRLPDLGPIGANGLANPRDFRSPTAWFDGTRADPEDPWTVTHKFGGKLFEATQAHSPFDVVAWHGNYCPFKYDLDKFCAVNSVTYDHMDPSIFTVLTCPSEEPGTAVADFVIFPPRWVVLEGFRPPYAHRNTMSEFMGLIRGEYDAKQGGFVPGGASLHNIMTPHGPDAATWKAATAHKDQHPVKMPDTMAFMFESCYMLKVCDRALQSPSLQKDYIKCWEQFPDNFTGVHDK